MSYEDIVLEDGKYTIRIHQDGKLECLRYGEPWRDLVGDKMVLAMAQEIQRLRVLADLKQANI